MDYECTLRHRLDPTISWLDQSLASAVSPLLAFPRERTTIEVRCTNNGEFDSDIVSEFPLLWSDDRRAAMNTLVATCVDRCFDQFWKEFSFSRHAYGTVNDLQQL